MRGGSKERPFEGFDPEQFDSLARQLQVEGADTPEQVEDEGRIRELRVLLTMADANPGAWEALRKFILERSGRQWGQAGHGFDPRGDPSTEHGYLSHMSGRAKALFDLVMELDVRRLETQLDKLLAPDGERLAQFTEGVV
jgi:hypothetical protein